MASGKRIGYAVVGLGSISQVAVLPAFAHSKKARLVAVVSGDKKKAKKYGQDFNASQAYSYDEFSECFENPQVEAVYIATPPGSTKSMQWRQRKRASTCSAKNRWRQPSSKLATWSMRAANKVLFMTAYRKYFEPSSLLLKKMITSGDLGRIEIIHTLFAELRPFGDSSPAWLFSKKLCGGGPLTDLGVYCVNTCRWLVDEDPVTAAGMSWVRDRRRYKEVEEGVAFRLDFPSGLVLQGSAAYSAAFSSFVHVHGEKGWAELAPAFAFEEERQDQRKGRWKVVCEDVQAHRRIRSRAGLVCDLHPGRPRP